METCSLNIAEFYLGQYAPITEMLFVTLHSVFGYNASAFHASSLLLHIGCVVLAYIILLNLNKVQNPVKVEPQVKVENVPLIAFLTALIFAVHPINVEAVAWISAVKAPLYSFFYLAATWTYIKFLNRRLIRYYSLTLILFALSFGAKEQAVTFPLWLLMLHHIAGHSMKERRVWLQVAPFFLLAVFFGVVTMLSQAATGGGVLSNAASYPFWQRLVLACYSLSEYAVKFAIPYNLQYIYPFPMTIGEALPNWLLVYPVALMALAMLLWKQLERFPLRQSVMFFLLHIAIVLHLVPLSRYAVIADRYIYLASLAPAFLVAYFFTKALGKRVVSENKFKYSFVAIFSAIMVTLGVYSNLRCREWKDTDSIKREIRQLLKQRSDFLPDDVTQTNDEQKTKKTLQNKITN